MSTKYDLDLLRRLWAAGESTVGIAAALGCSPSHVSTLRALYRLPVRRKQQLEWQYLEDPTPEQIAVRARREEKMPPPGAYRAGIKTFAWRTGRFDGVA